jgi:hypothetical protein
MGCDRCDTSRMRAIAVTNNPGRTLIGSVDDGGFFSLSFLFHLICFLSHFPIPRQQLQWRENEPVRLCGACRGAAERQQHFSLLSLSLCLFLMSYGRLHFVRYARSYVPVSPHQCTPELENVAAPCSPAVDSKPASQPVISLICTAQTPTAIWGPKRINRSQDV